MFLFRWIKNLILFVVFVAVVLVVIIFLLPKEYRGEAGVDIHASRAEVFSKAQDLFRWHAAAALNGISLDDMSIPKDINSHIQFPGVNVDTMLAGVKDAARSLKMRIKLVAAESPSRIVYIAEGGPMSGMRSEILLYELDHDNTKVTIKESFVFTGLLGGVKAFSVRIGMNKLNAGSLEDLKNICERGR